MGSKTLQLCFNVYAAAEENLYVSVEEVSELLATKMVCLPSLTLTSP